MTPIHDKQLPWHIAQARKAFVFWSTLPMVWTESFWKTWASVYHPEGK